MIQYFSHEILISISIYGLPTIQFDFNALKKLKGGCFDGEQVIYSIFYS
jgi:hypothetical protein